MCNVFFLFCVSIKKSFNFFSNGWIEGQRHTKISPFIVAQERLPSRLNKLTLVEGAYETRDNVLPGPARRITRQGHQHATARALSPWLKRHDTRQINPLTTYVGPVFEANDTAGWVHRRLRAGWSICRAHPDISGSELSGRSYWSSNGDFPLFFFHRKPCTKLTQLQRSPRRWAILLHVLSKKEHWKAV